MSRKYFNILNLSGLYTRFSWSHHIANLWIRIYETGHYITTITKKEINKLLEDGNFQYELFTEKIAEVEEEVEEKVEIQTINDETAKEVQKRIIRYVIRRNPTRMVEIRNNRDERLKKIIDLASIQTQYLLESTRRKAEIALRKVNEKIKSYKLKKAVSAEFSGDQSREISVKIDHSEYDQLGKLDGCYVVKTDLSKKIISAKDVHDRYKELSKVERAFKLLKTEFLEVRPLFVRLESRTRGHVFGSMLSYTILREIRRGLREVFTIDDEGRLSLDERNVIEALSRLTLLYYETDSGEMLPEIAEPDERQKKILDAIGVGLPEFGIRRAKMKTRDSRRK